MTIGIEEVEVVITRTDEHTINVKMGDLAGGQEDYALKVGDTVVVHIPSVLISRIDGIARTVTTKGEES